MDRKEFLKSTLLLSTFPLVAKSRNMVIPKKKNQIRLLRHATLVVQLGSVKFLVDPMLSVKDAMDPIRNAGNSIRIPMIDLPIDKHELNSIVDEVDAVLVTHTHQDHWDTAAMELINKSKPIFCQPNDVKEIKEQGFLNVTPIEEKAVVQNISIYRTGGEHGTGSIGKQLGPVSGFVLVNGKETIYIAGDTIWCDEVKNTLFKYRPTLTILNAGAAQFIKGDPISMTPDDIQKVYEAYPKTQIVAIHMDTINHCRVSRNNLKSILASKKLDSKILIPSDGEVFYQV